MNSWVLPAGLMVGLLYGMFGVGSALATPVLALVGIPGLTAVVTPLPGLLPSSLAGAWSYARNDHVDRRIAGRTIAAALPAAALGAAASHRVGGGVLLALSGVVLLLVGVRVLLHHPDAANEQVARRRREDPWLVPLMALAVGFASGLLANGGGFLLVPLFLVFLGLDVTTATGTSLVVASSLTIPTILVHILLGDVDWQVAALFAGGLTPGALLGGHVAQRLAARKHQAAFGALLVAFALMYLTRQLT